MAGREYEDDSWLNRGVDRRNYGSTNVPDVRIADPNATEFYQLCEGVTTNIFTINGNGKTLEKMLKIIGTSKDSKGTRDQIHLTQMSAKQIITQTTENLRRLNMIVRKGERQRKLQAERLTNEFKSSVQNYSGIQKQIAAKMRASFLPSSQPALDIQEEGNSSREELIAEEERRQQQQQLLQELEFEQGLLLEREQRMLQIESDIVDVNEIMKELSVMVEEQGQTVNTIENNIESAYTEVEQGRGELEKASQYQNKFRRRLCILLGVAAIVVTVLIIILVTQLKS